MAFLHFEEGRPPDELSLSLNGLPLARATPIHPGDHLRVGSAVLRFVDDSTPAGRIAEPRVPYGDKSADDRAALARSELVAEAPSMRQVLARVRKVAARRSNVLILGESGTGKDVVARAIHANGPRVSRRFVAVNAAAIPESTLESELFGHEKGSFTGAIAQHRGVFELASGGTLFLDEIGELSSTVQAKLLRVIECGEIRRVGGGETVRVDVRLIAATHRNLQRMVACGTFRQDLYYRLAVVVVRIPPLRQRREDIAPLVSHLLRELDPSNPPTLDPAVYALLEAHPFPGNVRELRNVLEAAFNEMDGNVIRVEHIRGLSRPPPPVDEDFPTLAMIEREHISVALHRCDWNRSRAATLLGVDRKTLYNKIQVYGLHSVASENQESSTDAAKGSS